jgi:hypothetical protein
MMMRDFRVKRSFMAVKIANKKWTIPLRRQVTHRVQHPK